MVNSVAEDYVRNCVRASGPQQRRAVDARFPEVVAGLLSYIGSKPDGPWPGGDYFTDVVALSLSGLLFGGVAVTSLSFVMAALGFLCFLCVTGPSTNSSSCRAL